MIARIMRRATQPTHDTNRRALLVLAVILVAALAFLAVTHHMFGLLGKGSAAPPAASAPPPAAAVPHAGAAKATVPSGPAPDLARNPFQAP